MSDDPNVNDQTLDPNTGAGAGDGQGEGGNETYFLEVDDRTRYKTAEEAAEGYRQAGQRIAELTPWQAVAQEYGLTDPNEIAALLDELAEARAAQQSGAARTQGAPPATTSAATAPATALDPNSPEGKEAAAIQWLQKNGVNAGLVNKETLDQLTERLDFLTQEAQRVDNERFEQRIDAGRSVLVRELQTAGFYPTDPKDTQGMQRGQELARMLEDSLTSWVNASEARIRAFHAGGEQLSNLVRTGLQSILPVLNTLKNSSGATIAATKTGANRRAAATPARTNTPARVAPARTTAALKPEDGITPDVHAKAWEIFQAARGDQA